MILNPKRLIKWLWNTFIFKLNYWIQISYILLLEMLVQLFNKKNYKDTFICHE